MAVTVDFQAQSCDEGMVTPASNFNTATESTSSDSSASHKSDVTIKFQNMEEGWSPGGLSTAKLLVC
eukprot:6468497-Amphidinium_carterae.1